MSNSTTSEQDLGPLIWVRGEIDLALARAAEALGDGQHGAGAEHLKFAQTHLHQARGALAIVGLDGLTHFCDGLEQLFSDWHAGRLSDTRDAGTVALRAIAAVRSHLDELVAGGVDQPMRLMPLYRDVMAQRGEAVVVPSELFFPDLTLRPPAPSSAAATLSPLERARSLRAARSQFERGLLRFLRDDREGLQPMRQAINAIEQTQSAPATRAFWWVCGALIDGMAQGAIQSDFFIKRLCARIDVQMRRLLEGSRGVAERLMRDSLYFIATAEHTTPLIRQVRDTYALDALLATSDLAGRDDLVALRPALSALRESLSHAKDAWTRFSSGAAVGLPQFHEQCEAMVAATTRVGQPDLARLAAALLDVGQWLRRDPLKHQDHLAMEIATALLVMDALVEQFGLAQSEDLPSQVDTLIDRLMRARNGEALPPMQIPLFDEMSRRAQERLFMGQVAHEILASLAEVEQQLDGYFRDPARAAELANLAAPLKQVEGALNMLGQDDAVALVRRCAAQIAEMAKPDHEVADGEFETLAHQLSGLGFFVDKLQYGPADLDSILNPRSAAREDGADGASVESELAKRREEAVKLLDRLSHGDTDQRTRDELRQSLDTIRQDAKLLGDEKLEQRAIGALSALSAGDAMPAALSDAMQGMGQNSAESLAPSAETVRLAGASQEDFDAELLDIFIEEAREVLGNIQSSTVSARQLPHSQELLTTLRRSFHTLKGSGRMVGLRDLGEAAYEVEQLMNRWLGGERDGTPALFDLIDRSHALFADWVEQLAAGDTRSPDHAWLPAACAALFGDPGDTGPLDAPVATAPGDDPGAAGAGPDIDFVLDFDLDLDEAAPDSGAAGGATEAESIEAAPAPDAGDALDLELDFDLEDLSSDMSALEAMDLTPDVGAENPHATATENTLLDLFLAEARGHLATLRHEMARLHVNPSLRPSQDSLLAAHTLGGTSRTVGQDDISALARSLEHAFERCNDIGDAPLAEHSALFNAVASTLEAQVRAVAEGTPATAAPSLVAQLDALFVSPAASLDLPVFDLPASDAEPTDAPAGPAAPSVLNDPAAFVRRHDDAAIAQARAHVATINAGLSDLRAGTTQADGGSVPAAHALGSLARTIGEPDIGALAGALEPALRCVLHADAAHGTHPLDHDLALLERCTAALDEQLTALDSEASPLPAPDLMADLAALCDRMAQKATATTADEPADEPAPASEQAFEKVTLPDEYVLPATKDPGATDRPRLQPLAPAPAAEPAAGPRVADDIDPQLLPIFIEEAHDLQRDIGRELRAWREAAAPEGASDNLRRLLHTLKGSARMAGAMRFGDLVHGMESRIEQTGSQDDSQAVLDDLDQGFDRCETLLAQLERGETDTQETVTVTDDATPAGDDSPARERPSVRVRADMVDRFVNEAGEMSIARTRIEGELRALRSSLGDLTENVQRLRSQLREIEIQAEGQMQSRMAAAEAQHEQFDPLEMDRFTRFQELSRMMAESLSDVTTVQYNLVRNLDASDTAIQTQARLNRDLSQALMSVRMVPFSTLEDRLYRVARQSAKELGKKVNLELRNTQIELDREVLEQMTGPIEHLLRNAVAHGIESREAREQGGKSETGEIVISLAQQTNEVTIELADDGAGLALDRIRARAIERGMLAEDTEVDERRLINLIFEPGFSTAEKLSELAGRGVGMDVVKSATNSLGGRIETTSQPGRGTRFRLSLPMTLAVMQAVLVNSGGKAYAIPSSMVQHAQELKPDMADTLRHEGGHDWLGTRYDYRYLPRLLGDAQSQPGVDSWLLLLNSGNEFMALEVDSLRGNQEIVVKPIGPQLSKLAGISGATVLPDGEATLIVNPVAIATRSRFVLAAQAGQTDGPDAGSGVPAPLAPVEPVAGPPLIMVVDDSLTVRKVTSRMLEREGYRVVTAKDGVDALEQLLDLEPAVMLVDIEMPRMDGFDLTRNIRADARTRDIPIIMITSRLAEKHQAYAREIGVNHYLGKPYNELELLELIFGYVNPA
jgi:chemosensory pili system protein ChpA (sensor histidine kinase/response regulator)